MSEGSAPDPEVLTEFVRGALSHAEGYASRMGSAHTWLIVTAIVTSAATTLVTGITAVTGPIVGEGPRGWAISCVIAAFFGFATTLCVGLSQGFHLADRLALANECTGRLRALQVAIATGGQDWARIGRDFEEIVRAHPEAVRRPR